MSPFEFGRFAREWMRAARIPIEHERTVATAANLGMLYGVYGMTWDAVQRYELNDPTSEVSHAVRTLNEAKRTTNVNTKAEDLVAVGLDVGREVLKRKRVDGMGDIRIAGLERHEAQKGG